MSGEKDLTSWKTPEITINRALETYLKKGYSEAWTGMTTKEYKQLKGLKKENLRDNMTNMDLVLNMLAEVSATEISQAQNPKGLSQHKKSCSCRRESRQ